MFFKTKKVIAHGNLVNLYMPNINFAKEYLMLTNSSINFHHPWVLCWKQELKNKYLE